MTRDPSDVSVSAQRPETDWRLAEAGEVEQMDKDRRMAGGFGHA